jgi:hypothetical protein
MNANTPVRVDTIDPAAITDVVRRAVGDPLFEVLTMSVAPLSHEKIIETTGGLYHLSGMGSRAGDASTPWNVVLKVVNRPGPQDSDAGWEDPAAWNFWRREPLSFQSGMLAQLPAGVRAPRCFGVAEIDEGAWIWMEHVEESRGRRWTLEEFHRAARSLGRFAAAYLRGKATPAHPWLCPAFFRSLLGDGGWWATHMDPASPVSIWENQLVAERFKGPLRSGVLQIWSERQRLFQAIDGLPQVLCHNDLHRRNLIMSADPTHQEQLVALDWTFCGPGAVGMDMGELVVNSTYFFENEPDHVDRLETSVLEGYQAGLREGGWDGDPKVARIGYLLSSVLWMGATLPGWTAYLLGGGSSIDATALFGRGTAEVLSGWVTLAEFILDRAAMLRRLLQGA